MKKIIENFISNPTLKNAQKIANHRLKHPMADMFLLPEHKEAMNKALDMLKAQEV